MINYKISCTKSAQLPVAARDKQRYIHHRTR